ncbi:MAG: PhoH family protein [Myxococcaceae bacterium]|nr:PhoH family protein [Myxococcaceae bacterium]
MKQIHVDDNDLMRSLAGAHNENLKLVERRLGVKVGQRGTDLSLTGTNDAAVELASELFNQLLEMLKSGRPVFKEDVEQAIKVIGNHDGEKFKDIVSTPVLARAGGRQISPKGVAQKAYVDAIRSNDIVFGVGPAGTGKTYLAMAMAVAALLKNEVTRIVLTRPAVEAGERLGFLPGDLAEKVNPYLRPLYDALNDMVDPERARRYMDRGTIEVAPLAFMRGRTLNDSFVILDEAQNTTREQMKMFLTRLGFGSKAVITGDVTQIDLPMGKGSGLIDAREILQDVPGIRFVRFDERDVVRHRLVQQIITAYERVPDR